MYAVLPEESLTRLCWNTESTINAKDSPCLHAHNCISNSAILNNNCIVKWFVRMCTSFENGIINETIVVQWAVRTALWDFKVVKKHGLVHCLVWNLLINFVWKPLWNSHAIFEVAHLKKKKRRRRRRRRWLWFWLSFHFVVRYFCDVFYTTRCVVGHEALRNEW